MSTPTPAATPGSGLLSSAEKRAKFWIDIASKFGVPTAILAAVMFAMWRGGSWFADNVALPGMQAHLKFLEKTTSTQEAIVATQGKLVEEQIRTRQSQDATNSKLGELIDEYRETKSVLLKSLQIQQAVEKRDAKGAEG